MWTFAIFLALILGVRAQVNPVTLACNADDCLLAVTSASPTGTGLVDCLSYLITTVTPAASTSTWMVYATTTLTLNPITTVTKTAYVTTTDVENLLLGLAITDVLVNKPSTTLKKRQQRPTTSLILTSPAPSAIPTYASVCGGAADYSSACSCIGATAATITGPTPRTTVNSTITITESITIAGTTTVTTTATLTTIAFRDPLPPPSRVPICGPTPTFILSAVGGGPYAGQYATLAPAHDGLPSDLCIDFVAPKSDASPFSIDSAGHLHSGANYANVDASNAVELMFFDPLAFINQYHYPQATCSVLLSKALQCAAAGKQGFWYCPDAQGFGSCAKVALVTEPVAGCVGFELKAVYDCVL